MTSPSELQSAEPLVGPPPVGQPSGRTDPVPAGPEPTDDETRPWSLAAVGAEAKRLVGARPGRLPVHGRRVKRIVRRVELWSVLKVSLLFYACVYVVTLLSGVLLWGFAYSAGLIDNFESFMADVGFDDFRFYGDEIFRRAAIIGAVLVLAGAVLTVLAAALVNVISELCGGIRFVVIEVVEPSARREPSRPDLAAPRWRDETDPARTSW